MSHTIAFNFIIGKGKEVTFKQITSLNFINEIWSKKHYVILVQNEDTVDVWLTLDKVRGCDDLVRYYQLMYDREINEQDLVVLIPVS